MGKKILLVDLDDTVWGLLDVWVQELNNRYNLKVKIEDCHHYDMDYLYPMLNDDEIYSILAEESLWNKVKPIKNSTIYLPKLLEFFDIYFVSSTDYRNISFKVNLIHKYFPYIDNKHLIFTHNKQLVYGDYLIDDYQKNLIGGKYKGLLMNAQHNLTYNSIFPRFDDWKDIYNYLIDEVC